LEIDDLEIDDLEIYDLAIFKDRSSITKS